MKKTKSKKSLIITTATILFTIFFIILSLGFSASSSNLAVDGSLLVRSDEDVRITNVQLNTKFLQAASQTKIPSYTVHSVAGGVRLTTSSSQIVYDVTVTNLSSQDVLVTSVNDLEWSNINMQYELENLVINETKIPAASSYTFQIKVTFKPNIISKIMGLAETIIENVLGISLNLNMALDFTFYKIPQYTLNVVTDQSDSTVIFEKDGAVVATGTGSLQYLFAENDNVTWTVTKEGYYSQTGTETMTENITRNITMNVKGLHTFTVVPNVEDAVVTLKVNGEVVATGQGTQSYSGPDQTEIEYIVTKFGYKDVTGTYQLNQADYTLNVTLESLEQITGTFVNTDSTVATTGNATVNYEGYYLIDIWGGSGADKYNVTASNTGYGASGAHIYGVVYLKYGSTIYYTLGGSGQVCQLGGILGGNVLKSVAGANGGGIPDEDMAGSGGGYSAFAINTTTITEADITSGNVLFIAAGGGGGGGASTKTSTTPCGNGGAGGDFNSATSTIDTGIVFHGYDGTIGAGGSEKNIGHGGTTTGGTCAESNVLRGKFLTGGTTHDKGGAGGAGYYGGAGGAGNGSRASKASSGGGGGSSYVSNSVTYTNLSDTVTALLTTSNPSTTGGSVIISYLGKTY